MVDGQEGRRDCWMFVPCFYIGESTELIRKNVSYLAYVRPS